MARFGRFVPMAAMVATLTVAALGSAQPSCPQADEARVMVVPLSFGEITAVIGGEAGFFRKHCLDVRRVPLETSNVGFARALTGTVDFAESSVGELLLARMKDLKLKAVLGASDGVPWALVVRSDVPLPNAAAGYPAVMKDLAGRKVGVPRLGSEAHRFAASLFRGAGTEPGAYVGHVALPQPLAALGSGAVDAAMLADPGPDLAVAGGAATIAVDLRGPGTGPADVQRVTGTFHVKVAAEAFLDARADVARRYVLASEEAARWVREPANFAEVVKHVRATVTAGRQIADADRVAAEIAKRYVAAVATSVSRRSVDAWHAYEAASGGLKTRIRFDEAVWSAAPVSP